MKKIALLFLTITCLILSAHSTKAQTLWGTLPDAFYHSSTIGDYGEAFKDVSVGSEPGRSIFVSPDNTLYSFSNNKTIYKFRAGDLMPSVVFRSDSITLFVHLIDFDNGYIYCTGTNSSGPMIFRLNLDGTGFTILRSNDGAGGYGGLIKDNDKFFGFRSNGVFTMNIDGSSYNLIRTITDPSEILTKLAVHSETDLYAISRFGGLCGRGAMFSLTKDGSSLTKLIEFRGSDDCGIPPPDEGAPVPEMVEEPYFEIAASEEPVGLMKDPGDDGDWFIITYGSSVGEEGYGALYMYGQDGLTLLRGFSYNHGNPNGTMAMNSTGQLYGLCGVLDDFGGKIFRYDFTGGGFSIVFDFDYDDIGSIVTTFALAPDGRFYGQAERTTFNYMQAGSIFSLNQNGSDPKQLFYFKNSLGPQEIAYNNGTLAGVFSKAGETEYGSYNGTVFTYSPSGVNTIYDFGDESNTDEADSAQLTVGSDGYAYLLVHRYNYMLKIKLDGSTSQKTLLPSFLTSAPLTETSSGLFGSSYFDDTNPGGFLYKVNSDFGGITPIYSFAQATGYKPRGKLTEGSDNFLYGMTSAGGSSNLGVIYKVRANGTDYSVIHHFAGADGASPHGGLLKDGDFFFGLSSAGGANSKGTLFKIKFDGTGFTKLFDFGGANGDNPKGDLVEDGDGFLYGVTRAGGQQNKGVLFKTDKIGNFSVLKNFDRSPRREHVTFASQAVGETSSLESPSDTETEVSGSPEVKFHNAKYAVLYTLELSLNPAFTGTLITKTINGPIGEIDGLSYSTTYYARVKVDATPGYGPVTSFTTRSLSSDAYVISPADGAVHVPINNVSVTANAVTGASLYTIELNTSAAFTGTSFVQTSSSPGEQTLTFDGLSNYIVYYSRVKTDINPNWGPTKQFTAIGAETFVIDPANNQSGIGYFGQIQIQPLAGATNYTLVLDFTRSDGATGTETYNSGAPVIDFFGLEYSSTYTARVYTDINPNFGPTTTFYTVSPETDAYLISPVNGATGVLTNIVAQSNVVWGAATYTVELNTNATFTGTSIVKTSTNSNSIIFSGLSTATTYYSRVKTDLSPIWGVARSFTTTAGQDVYITSPANTEMEVSVTPLIKISPLAGATEYTLQLSEVENFTGTIITLTSSEPNIRSTPLKYLTRYYVRAKTNLSSGYGLVTWFYTHYANKYAFVSNPGDGATNVATNNLKVTANIVYGATSYTIELSTNPEFLNGTSIFRTSAIPGQRTLTFNGLTSGTTYYSRVTTNVYSVPGPTRSFTTAGQPIQVIDPINGKTEVTVTPLIKVQTVPSATQYTLELSTVPDFTSAITLNSPSPQFGITLQYSTTYYARAKTNLSGFGPVTSFSTHAPEKFSFVSSPVNGATNVGIVNVPITANIVYGATIYTIELNTSPDFTGTSIVRSSAVPNQRSIIFPSLAPSTRYYNRTRTNLPSGWGPVRSFTTTSAGAPPPMEELSEGVEVMVYPNPFQRTFTAEIRNRTGDGNTSFVLFDLTGREMYKIETRDPSVELGDDLPQGIYILRLTNNNRTFIKRVIKK